MKGLFPGLVRGGIGMPDVSTETRTPQQVFADLPWTTWDEAELGSVLHYLRGNRHLKVPKCWAEVFPRPFETLFRLEQNGSLQ